MGLNFNQPLSDSLSNLLNLQQLTLGYYFNQPLSNSLSNLLNLQQLNFGFYFNKPLSDSLSKLINLKHLSLGNSFNQQLEIPSNIIKLSLDCSNEYIINNLPNSIDSQSLDCNLATREELNFGYHFNLELDNLQNSIKKIKFDIKSQYNKELNNLPIGLEYLELSKNFNNPIKNISSNLLIHPKSLEICTP